jgi:hypothetical protein
MAESPQEQAERLALQARRKMLAEDLEGASEDQRDAVSILRVLLDDLKREMAPDEERKEIAQQLADYWGRLGGMYRRRAMAAEGIEAYGRGKELEREYKLDESYNRTNWIVLKLLDDPAQLEALQPEIDETTLLIAAQVRGPRRDEWWAWADLGLLRHLGGQPAEARTAYEQFQRAGARPSDYRSVLSVLEPLRAAFQEPSPELAAELSTTIGLLSPHVPGQAMRP